MVKQWSNNGRTGLFDGLSVLKSVYYFDFCIFFQFFALKRPIFVYFSLFGVKKFLSRLVLDIFFQNNCADFQSCYK